MHTELDLAAFVRATNLPVGGFFFIGSRSPRTQRTGLHLSSLSLALFLVPLRKASLSLSCPFLSVFLQEARGDLLITFAGKLLRTGQVDSSMPYMQEGCRLPQLVPVVLQVLQVRHTQQTSQIHIYTCIYTRTYIIHVQTGTVHLSVSLRVCIYTWTPGVYAGVRRSTQIHHPPASFKRMPPT